jgi:glutamyl/glutaminyl-tRNA synthetase
VERSPEPGRRRLNNLPTNFVTRFAPSPTGYLHLGHVANAVHVWGLARAHGGRVLLRIEDHDRGRCRPEYQHALLQDLEWLGLEPDQEPSTLLFRQSDRDDAYTAALEQLGARTPVYACDCSRKEIAGGLESIGQESRYNGRCRTLRLQPGKGVGLRVVMEPGVERFTDELLGDQLQEPSEQCGDLLVRDRLGNWTYQFAVTVDDIAQNIDVVIRGEDLLGSTGRQIRLARLLGRSQPPVFLHHPLIRHPTGRKLSKADGDTGIRELRTAGVKRSAVLGLAAHLTGLMPAPRDISPNQLSDLFRPS